jgi:hypothetical protein
VILLRSGQKLLKASELEKRPESTVQAVGPWEEDSDPGGQVVLWSRHRLRLCQNTQLRWKVGV